MKVSNPISSSNYRFCFKIVLNMSLYHLVTIGKGVLVSEELFDTIIGDDDGCYPKLGHGTTKEDLEEALWVHGRQKNVCTTRIDLEVHRIEEDPVLAREVYGDVDLQAMKEEYESGYSKGEHVTISRLNEQMQKSMQEAEEKDKAIKESRRKTHRPTNIENEKLRLDWVTEIDKIRKDSRVTKEMMTKLDRGLKRCFKECWDSAIDKFGVGGGGENRIMCYGETQAEPGPKPKRHKGPKG